jgi:hypothetical protein
MSWKIYADYFESGQLANTSKFCTISLKQNIVLIGVRTWIVVYDNPTFTSLNMKIYSNEVIAGVNTPKKLLYTSINNVLKSEIMTLHNAIKEIYFEFDKVPINGNDKYNFVINGVDYSYSAGSHLAWVKAWPDPVYSDGFTANFESLAAAPYQLYCIGSAF